MINEGRRILRTANGDGDEHSDGRQRHRSRCPQVAPCHIRAPDPPGGPTLCSEAGSPLLVLPRLFQVPKVGENVRLLHGELSPRSPGHSREATLSLMAAPSFPSICQNQTSGPRPIPALLSSPSVSTPPNQSTGLTQTYNFLRMFLFSSILSTENF